MFDSNIWLNMSIISVSAIHLLNGVLGNKRIPVDAMGVVLFLNIIYIIYLSPIVYILFI